MSAPAAALRDPGPPPELLWLPIGRLDVDPAYQRTLETPRSKRLVATIANSFEWAKFGALLAAPGIADSDGARWNIVDGQHRAAGARARGGIAALPSVVFAGLSTAQQAGAFVGANRDRAVVSAQALFHARLVAGDTDAVVVKEACDRAGIAIERYNKAVAQLAAGRTAAVPVLLRIHKGMGVAVLRDTLSTAAECWGSRAGALSGPLFLGAAYYLKEGGAPTELAQAMRQLGIRRIHELVRGTGTETGGRLIADALKKIWPPSQAPAIAKPQQKTQRITTAAQEPAPAPRPPRNATAPAASPFVPPTTIRAALPDAKAAAEQDQIARFVAERGVTTVPPAFLAPSAARPDDAEANRRIAALTIDKDRAQRPGESRADWFRRISSERVFTGGMAGS